MSADDPEAASNTAPFPSICGALVRPRVWTAFVVFVTAVSGVVVVQTLIAVGYLFWRASQGEDIASIAPKLQEDLATPIAFIMLGIPTQLTLGLIAFGAAWLSPEPWRKRLGLAPSRLSSVELCTIALSAIVPLAAGVGLASALAVVLPADPSVGTMYERMTPVVAVPFVLFIAAFPGFNEELLFRGYIQRRLLARWSPWLAISVTSLLFALMHVMPHAILVAAPLGVWFGIVAWRLGSIWPSILMHAFVNGAWNILQVGTRLELIAPSNSAIVIVPAVLTGAMAFFGAIRILSRRTGSNSGA